MGKQLGPAAKATISRLRIDEALEIAVRYGGIDGDHHKAWVIDQMVRALTGCPNAGTGDAGESAEYQQFVADAKAGLDGPETYGWNLGVAP